MEPTEAEIQDMDTVEKVKDWIGIEAATWDGIKLAFGCVDDTPPRIVARILKTDFDNVASQVRVAVGDQQRVPNITQATQIGEFWEVACLAAGAKKLKVVQERESEAAIAATRAHELALAGAGVTHIGGGQTVAAPQPKTAAKAIRMVAFESTVDQTDRKSEVEVLSAADIQAAYNEYNIKLGVAGAPPVVPHPDEEPTIDQLTALKAVIDSGAPPNVDFSIWRPHANRFKKVLAFHGLHIGLDGAIVMAEMKGPSNLDEWLASWRIFKVASIMLKILSTAAADAYAGHITRLHTKYGAQVWLLLYQADIRFRTEHAERIRRKGEALKAKAGQDPCEFDPTMPWEFVFRTGVEDYAYWNREFETDALLVRAHIDSTQSHLGTDIGMMSETRRSAGSGGGSSSQHWDDLPPPPPKGDRQKGAGKKGDKGGGGGGPRFDSQGNFVTNRGGNPICFAYQTGECTETTLVNNAPRCAKDSSRVHQCSRCLGSHPSKPKEGAACAVPASQKTIRRQTWGKPGKQGGKGGKY